MASKYTVFVLSKTEKVAFIAVIAQLVIVSITIFNRFKISQKQKEIIEAKNKITEEQKLIIKKKAKRSCRRD